MEGRNQSDQGTSTFGRNSVGGAVQVKRAMVKIEIDFLDTKYAPTSGGSVKTCWSIHHCRIVSLLTCEANETDSFSCGPFIRWNACSFSLQTTGRYSIVCTWFMTYFEVFYNLPCDWKITPALNLTPNPSSQPTSSCAWKSYVTLAVTSSRRLSAAISTSGHKARSMKNNRNSY